MLKIPNRIQEDLIHEAVCRFLQAGQVLMLLIYDLNQEQREKVQDLLKKISEK